ncbi:MAG TPA: rhodanese-like domain-containing protein [Candidatus Angelobacter sp.]|nr:rhodanese-like domain-containing protein [Candidatus Angelobacter sp.]
MAELVDFSWIDQHSDDADVVVIDSRPPIKYLQGHIPRAVNLPTSRVFDKGTLELLPTDRLARIVGDAGIDNDRTILVCDDHDGQNEAMLAWTLEFLGHPRVKLLSSFMNHWTRENRPISYRPVKPEPAAMHVKQTPDVRATLEEVSRGSDVKLIDLRSRDEFEGKSSDGPKSKHLPGALSLPWTSLLGEEDQLFRRRPSLEALVFGIGLGRDDQIVTYCSFGPRAAIGYMALRELGFKHVKVYDRSFQRWTARTGLSLDNCVPAL